MEKERDKIYQELCTNVNKSARLYIGNLDYNTKVSEVKDIFGKYGEIVAITIKNGFAFVVLLLFL